MTDSERSVKISQAAGRLAKARRAWEAAYAHTQAMRDQFTLAQQAESEANACLALARRSLELAACDSEAVEAPACRVCGAAVPAPFKLYCCGEHQVQGNDEREQVARRARELAGSEEAT